MSDVTYDRFMKRWEEVTDMPPQSLGVFTMLYKRITKRMKVMPWPWFILLGSAIALLLYVVLGSSVSAMVTLLQRGF